MINSVPPIVAGADGTLRLEVNITIKNNVTENLDWLNRILFTKEPGVLVLTSQPDRYLLCELDGGIEFTSRFHMSRAVIKFKSEDKYWRSMKEPKVYVNSWEDGSIKQNWIEVENKGTAPTYPIIQVDFPTDMGYFSLVSPNGFLAFGDDEQLDHGTRPRRETVLEETLGASSIRTWTPITSDSHAKGLWVPDYNKLSIGTNKAFLSANSIWVEKTSTPKPDYYWNTWGYYKRLDQGELDPADFNNWQLKVDTTMYTNSLNATLTAMFLIIVMDAENRPIMTTSMYNVGDADNSVTATAKINDFSGGANNKSRIIHSHRFRKGFSGMVVMEKSGDRFNWDWSNRRETRIVTTQQPDRFGVGDTVYIKNSTSYYYHMNGTRYPVQSFTKGRPNKITRSRTFQGKKQYEIAYGGVVVAWLFESDLTTDKTGVGITYKEEEEQYTRNERHSIRSSNLSQLVPDKVVIIGGTWNKTGHFEAARLSHMRMERVNNGSTVYDAVNTFTRGDRMIIDSASAEVLVNGVPFYGRLDPASKFFDLDYGKSDISILASNWGRLPEVKIQVEERYR